MPLSTAQLLILKRALRTVPPGTRLQEPVVAAAAAEAGLTREYVKQWARDVLDYYDTPELMARFLSETRVSL